MPRLLHVRTNRRVKKPRATVVMIHGIGNTGDAWSKLIDKLPLDVNVVAVDLLGFGSSPKPSISYNLRVQARSVMATVLKTLPARSPIILIGHSMGALVAIEIAKRYPRLIKKLILCSPPLYDVNDRLNDSTLTNLAEKLLSKAFTAVSRTNDAVPPSYMYVANLAKTIKLTSPAFEFNEQTVPAYLSALRSSILDQKSIDDILTLSKPIAIIYGRLDPLIVPANYKKLAACHDKLKVMPVTGMHEVGHAHINKILLSLAEAGV